MRIRWAYLCIGAVLAVSIAAGCRVDGTAAERTTDMLPAADSLSELRFAEESGARADVGGATETLLGEGPTGVYSLLAPTLPGFSMGTFSTTCDPFADAYGSCL